MSSNGWAALADELSGLLRLDAPPIGITFSSEKPDGVADYDAPMPSPTPGKPGAI